MHILIKNKYLIYDNYRIKCAVGKRGINIKKKEGDFITPKGLYKINYILYRKDKVKNLNNTIFTKNMPKDLSHDSLRICIKQKHPFPWDKRIQEIK